jgi:hypothetical protein
MCATWASAKEFALHRIVVSHEEDASPCGQALGWRWSAAGGCLYLPETVQPKSDTGKRRPRSGLFSPPDREKGGTALLSGWATSWRCGLLWRLSKNSTDVRRVKPQPGLWAVTESHRAEIVRVAVDEIPADPKPPRDLGGVNQLAADLTRSQQIGHPSCHRLYVRIAEGHRLLLLSARKVVCIGHLHRISPKIPANAPGNSRRSRRRGREQP